MREVIRRLVAATALYVGLAMVMHNAPRLLRTEAIDWRDEAESKQRRSFGTLSTMARVVGEEAVEGIDLAADTRGPLEAFIASATEDRLIVVSGETWERFFNAAAAARLDQPPSPAWQARRGRNRWTREYVYFRPDEHPLAEIDEQLRGIGGFAYVRVDGASRSEYLGVTDLDLQAFGDNAPRALAHPLRNAGAIVLLVGLAAYALIPRRRATERTVYYNAIQSGWLPDVLAAGGSGAFLVMMLAVSASINVPLLSGGGALFLLMMGLPGAIFASLWIITARYQSRRLTWDETSFTYECWGLQRRTHRLEEIKAVEGYISTAPKWLKRMLWFAAIFNFRAAGQALLMEREDAGLTVVLRDGARYRFVATGLLGAGPFLKLLEGRGVPVTGPAEALIGFKDPARSKAGRIAAWIFAIAIVGTASLFLVRTARRTQPLPKLELPAATFAQTRAFVLPRVEREPVPTPQMLAEQRRIIAAMQAIRTRMQETGDLARAETDPDRRQQHLNDFWEAKRELDALQVEFDAIGP